MRLRFKWCHSVTLTFSTTQTNERAQFDALTNVAHQSGKVK